MNKIIIKKDITSSVIKGITLNTVNNEINIDVDKNIKDTIYMYIYDDKYKNYNIKLNNNTEITLSIISEYNNININYNYTLLDDAMLIVNKFDNVCKINEFVDIELAGYNSSVFYNFSTISNDTNKYTINVLHKNKNTKSNVVNNAITTTEKILEFYVNATVLKDCKNSSLNQNTKIINFKNNNSKIYPNLFVDEYDVEAEHGAYIGNFKTEDIFYLMSRGINYKESINLLVKGFVLSNLTNIDTSYIIQKINNMESENE